MEASLDYHERDIPIYSFDQCNQQSSSYQEYETVWRSIAIAPMLDEITPAGLVSGVYGIDGKDVQSVGFNRASFLNVESKKSSSFPSSNVSIDSLAQYEKTIQHFLNKKAPDAPHHLVPTHIRINITCPETLGSLIFQITDFLNGIMTITFDFVDSKFEWDCYCSKNSSFTNLKIRICSDIFNEEILIVECSKMSGDCGVKGLYMCMYEHLFANFSVEEDPSNDCSCFEKLFRSSMSNSIHPLENENEIDYEELRMCLQSIVKLSRSNYLEAQVEASVILLRISSDDRMHASLFENGCIQCLMLLAKQEVSLMAKMNSIFALANLSETNSYHTTLVDLYDSLSKDFQRPFIFHLLDLVIDGPASTAEMRREAARIIFHISSTHANKIASDIGPDAVNQWVSKVDTLIDAKLKVHARMAKKAFAPFI